MRDNVHSVGFSLSRNRLTLHDFHKAGLGCRWKPKEPLLLKNRFRPGTDSWKDIAVELKRSPKYVSKNIWELGLA